MSTFFLPADKAEEALAALVLAIPTLNTVAGTTVQVVTGKNAGDKDQAPLVVCSAEAEDTDDPPFTGNYWINGMIAIKTPAVTNEDGTEPTKTDDDQKAENQSLLALIWAALQVDDLAAQLTAAVGDFTVFPASVQFGGPKGGRDEHGLWVDTLPVRFLACGRALG